MSKTTPDSANEKLEKFKRMLLTHLHEALIDDFTEPSLIDVFRSWANSQVALRIVQEVYGRQGPRWIYRHPRDSWQALKARYAPQWFLRRWPVIEMEITFDAKLLYPRGQTAEPIINVTAYRDGHEIWLKEEADGRNDA